MAAAALYTPEVLGLAAGLAEYPWDDALPMIGEARSKSCGSTIALGLSTDSQCRIDRLGMRCHACAIGQASAAIFARGAIGRTLDEIGTSGVDIAAWLSGDPTMPAWPDLAIIAPARDYPARHGAITLAWKAADDMLPTTRKRR